MLAQIKDHYRNPLIAADASVSVDEATQLFGMASALISLMAEAVAAKRRPAIETSVTAKTEGEEDSMYDFRMKEAG
jgi:hypothetical protein